MAEFSGIAWTDHTMNFWIGCTEASAHGCSTCYARELDKRYQYGQSPETAKANRAADIAPHWGQGMPRHRTAPGNWRKPFIWNARAAKEGIVYKVFTSSLADFFDNEIDPAWRAEAWTIIRDTLNLRWQILTKRVPNIHRMLPPDWGKDGYPNVGFVASCVTQAEFDRDSKRLLNIPARWHGFSFEPQVEQILPVGLLRHYIETGRRVWIITGGDSAQPSSGHEARPYDVQWARGLIREASVSGYYVFVKQLGARPVGAPPQTDTEAGGNVADWPEDIVVRDFPPEILS